MKGLRVELGLTQYSQTEFHLKIIMYNKMPIRIAVPLSVFVSDSSIICSWFSLV